MEKALENRWDALMARVLGRERVELLDALLRECDSKAVAGPQGRVMVPNAYDVALADAVHEELTRRGGRVGQFLTDSLVRHAERRGYSWPGPPTVHITRRSDVPNGRYLVAGGVMPHVNAGGFPLAPGAR
nr:DUF3662 domain-containing protein [Streptomyces sp. SID8352]